MTAKVSTPNTALAVDEEQPPLTLITLRDGHEVVCDARSNAGRTLVSDETARNALSVFGASSDLDWDEAAEALDRIRHESAPTP